MPVREFTEDVVGVPEEVDHSQLGEHAHVFWPDAFDGHGDAASFERGDDHGEGVGAGGVDELQPRET